MVTITQIGSNFTSNPQDPVGLCCQRSSCYVNGYYWLIYNDGTNSHYASSADGITWATNTLVTGINRGYKDSIHCDGTYIHYVTADDTNTSIVYYRLTPGAGTLTIPAGISVPVPVDMQLVSYASVTTHGGYPIVAYACKGNTSGFYQPAICVATATNGSTWGAAAYLATGYTANMYGISVVDMDSTYLCAIYDNGGSAGSMNIVVNSMTATGGAVTSQGAFTVTTTGFSASHGMAMTANAGGGIAKIIWIEGTAAPNLNVKCIGFTVFAGNVGFDSSGEKTLALNTSARSVSCCVVPWFDGSGNGYIYTYMDSSTLNVQYILFDKNSNAVQSGTLCTASGTNGGEGHNMDMIANSSGVIGLYFLVGTANPWIISGIRISTVLPYAMRIASTGTLPITMAEWANAYASLSRYGVFSATAIAENASYIPLSILNSQVNSTLWTETGYVQVL